MNDISKNIEQYNETRDKLKHYKELITKEQPGMIIPICSIPKSGSAFVQNVLIDTIPELEILGIINLKNRPHLDEDLIVANYFKNGVRRAHLMANEYNIEMFKKYQMKPLVIFRNIYDIIPSLREEILKNGNKNESPAFFHDGFFKISETKQYDFIIDMCVPYMLNFVVSWLQLKKNDELNYMLITYEQLMDNRVLTFEKIMDFYQLNYSIDILENNISCLDRDKKRSNKNIGIVGRGKKLLSTEQCRRVDKICSNFNDCDLAVIGLS